MFKYDQPIHFDGVETVKVVNVSEFIGDATQALWDLYDLTGSPIVGVVAPTSVTSVTLTIVPALQAGDYNLVGIQ